MDVRLPDGTVIQGVPDGISRADLTAKLARNGYDVSKLEPAAAKPTLASEFMGSIPVQAASQSFIGRTNPREAMAIGRAGTVQGAKDITGGAIRGAGSIGATVARPFESADENQARRLRIDENMKEFLGANPESFLYGGSKLGAEIAGTAGVGGFLGNVAARTGMAAPVTEALRTAGMRAGGATGIGGLAARTVGGAAVGGASAGLVNLEDAGTGAMISGALPVGVAGAKYAGQVAGRLVSPLTQSGQYASAAEMAQKFATNPQAAAAELRGAQELVPGSRPIAAAASGDVGLSNLTRTLQNASPEFAAELQTRQWAQNAARTNALEDIAGNVGKLKAAKEARNTATGPLRESALTRAGQMESAPMLSQIDMLIQNPENAGKLSQQALSGIKSQIEGATKNGVIDSRALYAIRKDINDVLSGKLSGEAGNLRYASEQLRGVKGVIDDAIERATGGVSASRGAPVPQSTWGQYLQDYTTQSKPINQMETLQDVLRRAQTGTADNLGNLTISGPKLNTILKNETEALKKVLEPEQLDTLRKVAADITGSNLGMTAGKAVGSNTLQNASQDALLKALMGNKWGGSTMAQTALGNLLKLPYIRANQKIMDELTAMAGDPKMMAQALEYAPKNRLLELLQAKPEVLQMLTRTAPLIPAQ